MKPIKTIKDGRRTIKVYHDNFEYFQPNDHVAGDCSIRAVCGALNLSWHTALDKLVSHAHKLTEPPTSRESVDALLKENGFVWHPVSVLTGSKRPKVSDFCKKNEGTLVLSVASHLVCSKNGKYNDCWDCGEKCVYGYWEKK